MSMTSGPDSRADRRDPRVSSCLAYRIHYLTPPGPACNSMAISYGIRKCMSSVQRAAVSRLAHQIGLEGVWLNLTDFGLRLSF